MQHETSDTAIAAAVQVCRCRVVGGVAPPAVPPVRAPDTLAPVPVSASPIAPKHRRAALAALPRDTLTALTTHYGLDVADRRVVANHVDALVRSRSIEFADLLGRLARDELKTVCEALDLPTDGREKQVLIDRILAVGDAANIESLQKSSGKLFGAHASNGIHPAPDTRT